MFKLSLSTPLNYIKIAPSNKEVTFESINITNSTAESETPEAL